MYFYQHFNSEINPIDFSCEFCKKATQLVHLSTFRLFQHTLDTKMPDITDLNQYSFQFASGKPRSERVSKLKKGLEHANTLEDLQAALTAVRDATESLTSNLQHYVSSTKASQSQDLRRVNLLRAQLGNALSSSHELAATLGSASFVASNLSSKVRRIDLEQSRVKESLTYVSNVIELKSSVHGARAAMDTRDWDRAAWYVHKATSLPEQLVGGAFAKAMVPTAEFPDYPEETLNEASKSLGAIFLREFGIAAAGKDMETLTRYFKLFPLIGQEKEGLEVYAKFICGIITAQSRTRIQNRSENSLFYGITMTRLFENIAAIVNQHAPIVERHYGKGRMVKVLDKVQDEADSQGGLIIDTYWDERAVARLLNEIQGYSFPHLVSSFAMNSAVSRNQQGRRAGSPALDNNGTPASRRSEEEAVDLKSVGELTQEASVMMNRWSLYRKFLGYKWPEYSTESNVNEAGTIIYMPDIIKQSNFEKKIQTRLGPAFETMATFCFRRSVEKALQLEEMPDASHVFTTESPLVTSVVEDVMYILNIILQQAVDTGELSIIKNVLSSLRRILESDFVGAMQRKLRDEAPRAVSGNVTTSSNNAGLVSRLSTPPLIGGTPRPGTPVTRLAGLTGADETKLRTFIIYINNLQVASEYTSRIINGVRYEDTLPFDQDASKTKELLDSLARNFQSRCDELLNDSLQVAFKQVTSARIRNITNHIFKDTDFMVTPSKQGDDSMTNSHLSASDMFGLEWDIVMHGLTRVMAPSAYTKFISHAAVLLSRTLESRVWALEGKVNELGAIRLDREISRIIGKVSNGRYSLREKFIRVAQMVMIIGLDDSDEEEGISWVLNHDERRRARMIRVERRE